MQSPSPPLPLAERLRRATSALELSPAHVVALLVLASLGCVGLVTLSWTARPLPIQPVATDGAAPPSAAASPTPARPRMVVVHVSGAVVSEGVHELAAGSRVVDAIDAAGGVRRRAQTHQLNLARPLHDGEQVHVPTAATAAARDASGPDGTAGGAAAPADAGRAGTVSLNTADVAQLETLPGVGPVLAARIVQHRASSGGFAAVEDLLLVEGIGEKTFAQLRDLVTL